METASLINEGKVAGAIEGIIDTGLDLLKSDELTPSDYGKLKVMRTMSSNISNAVIMIQQRTARERHVIVRERMAQMGFGQGPMPKKIAPVKK